MSVRTIEITVPAGTGFTGRLSLPPAGKGPGIIVLQEIFGVNANIRAIADRFAEEGYVVLAPDVFWRQKPGVDLGYSEADFGEAFGLYKGFDVDQGVADIGAAIAALRALPECTGKVGVIGYCLGGLLTYLTAARHDIDASSAYYGGGIDKYLAEAGNVRCPIAFHFGGVRGCRDRCRLCLPRRRSRLRQCRPAELRQADVDDGVFALARGIPRGDGSALRSQQDMGRTYAL
jgi:carboxymethylenebutenolidase